MSYLRVAESVESEALAFGDTVRQGAARVERLASTYERGLLSAAYNSLDERVWDAADALMDEIGRGARYLVRSEAAKIVEGLMAEL